ncbi:MAG TPA: YncE family protein, partial [Burkholderiaceae bacterium]|nr:YncE family protein [Burkholderiaceae bacterium]
VLTAESRGMAFDGLHLWVALYGINLVLKVNINTGQVVATVAVGIKPHSIAYNGSHLFVTNFGSNSVSKIDPSSATVVASIPVGANPAGIAVNPFYGTVWVANSGGGTVSVFYGSSTAVEATVTVGTTPLGVASEGYYVWVTNTGSNTVSRLGAWVGSAVQTTVTLSAAPQTILYDYANLWVITGTNALAKIPAGSATATMVALPTGAVPAKMCFNGTYILVQCANQQVYRVDVQTNAVLLVSSGSLGSGSNGVLAYDGVSVWAADQGNLYSALL